MKKAVSRIVMTFGVLAVSACGTAIDTNESDRQSASPKSASQENRNGKEFRGVTLASPTSEELASEIYKNQVFWEPEDSAVERYISDNPDYAGELTALRTAFNGPAWKYYSQKCLLSASSAITEGLRSKLEADCKEDIRTTESTPYYAHPTRETRDIKAWSYVSRLRVVPPTASTPTVRYQISVDYYDVEKGITHAGGSVLYGTVVVEQGKLSKLASDAQDAGCKALPGGGNSCDSDDSMN